MSKFRVRFRQNVDVNDLVIEAEQISMPPHTGNDGHIMLLNAIGTPIWGASLAVILDVTKEDSIVSG